LTFTGLWNWLRRDPERKQAEEALRKTAAYYRVLAETAEDHIFVINQDDRVEYVNQAAARQLKALPEQIIGRPRTEIFPPDVAERQGRSLRRVFETRQPLYVEGRTLYLDREVWLGTWLAPVPDGDGGIRAVLGLSRDMTERKHAEDALRDSEQRLRVVLSNIPLVLWAVNLEGIVTFCRGRALSSMGAAPDDIVGRAFEAIAVDPFPGLAAGVRRSLAGERVNNRVDVHSQTFEAWSVPVRDEKNQIAGATGVIVDSTERRRLEVELANVQKLEAIGRLAGGIAHDFNNHLTAILGYVEMLLRQTRNDTQMTRDLGEVQQAAQRAAGLVRRLLAFGRRQVLQPRSLNLNRLIESLEPMLERLLGEVINVEVRLEPGLRPITGDSGELEQVIMNLALNARDAMPDGGTLTIETSNVAAGERRPPTMGPGAYVRMTIRDTGTGMDAAVRQQVFDPFFTTKPEGQGTGLGLSTVYGIVKQLNGFIWVDSELRRGSAFHVYMPAGAAEVEREPARPSAEAPSTGRGVILLVEDEHTVRRFARLALERHGFVVIEAATPEEALTLAASSDQPLSMLLTDVVMPRMNGRELSERLAAVRPNLPVLYMSGYPSSLVVRDGLVDPSVRLMSKPFTTSDLITAVQDVLNRA